jgi:hypothetical protein
VGRKDDNTVLGLNSGLALSRQALYHLSHISNPYADFEALYSHLSLPSAETQFCISAQTGLNCCPTIYAACVPGITGELHYTHLVSFFFFFLRIGSDNFT